MLTNQRESSQIATGPRTDAEIVQDSAAQFLTDRDARIADLRARVRANDYRVNPYATAEAIITHLVG